MAKKTKKDKQRGPAYRCCGGLLALIAIILVWWKPAMLWSQIVITVILVLSIMHKVTSYTDCKR
jgi:hypothetical protein